MQVVNGMAGDIAGHQVGRELDAREIAVETTRQGTYQQGFAQPRDTFEQHMAAGDQRGKDIIDHLVLANHGLA